MPPTELPFAPAFGYAPNPAATEAFVASLPPVYADALAALPSADDDRDALNYRALARLAAKTPSLAGWLKPRDGVPCLRSLNQGSIGSCVGNATARDLDVLGAVEIIIGGEAEELPGMAAADGLYGLGREKAGMLRGGDGLYGSAIADAIREWGTLWQIRYGTDGGQLFDLSTYTVDRCRQFGRQGVGDTLKNFARQHLVRHTARVTSAAEGWSLIGSGYTINQCSNIGWKTDRDAEGRCHRRGSWSHSMAATSRRTTKAGDRLVLIHQSWGDDWTGGPYWEDQPWGSFWISLEDFGQAIAQRDTFVYASFDGFVPRNLPDFGFDYLN